MASTVNPYRAPTAAVADAAEQFQPVNIYGASGRIGRARYIAYTLGVSILFGICVGAVVSVLGYVGYGTIASILTAVLYIGMFVWMYRLTMQRAHDFNTTGWLALVVFIPLVNLIFWIIPGTDGENRFGAKTPPNSTLVLIAAWLVPALFIAGIVAAVALPAYQGYVKRAQMMEKK